MKQINNIIKKESINYFTIELENEPLSINIIKLKK